MILNEYIVAVLGEIYKKVLNLHNLILHHMNHQPPKPVAHGKSTKIVVFKIIALLLPVVIFLLLEVGLRIFGYGHDVRLFVEDKENAGYLVMNPYASERYFTADENATKGVFEPFRKKKAPGTFRVFVLGESTTLGFPYMGSASFDRWLFYRLMHTFPDREFEIVNVSLTAVNSYTVLGFAKEIVNYEPDAVMIYCGQNEYYGALGVGSTSQLGNHRSMIQSILYLRSFRVVQLMENGYSEIKKKLKGHVVDKRETLMKRMAAKQEIPFHSALYNRGIEQFQYNMGDLCKLMSKKRIPVFISNLVSNEKDLKPFISSGKNTATTAIYQYHLAEKALKAGDYATAKKLFVLAKDLDMLRFRAPDTLNDIIAGFPHKYPGVYMVDTKKLFEKHSPHGIIGNETLLEHVHPNIYGYGLLSEAFYQSLKQHRLILPDPQNEISLLQLQRDMPITLVDSLKGTFEIMVLQEKWPFNQPKTIDLNNQNSFEAKLAIALLYQKTNWIAAMKSQLDYYSQNNDQKNTLKVAEASVLQITNNADYLSNVGKLCVEQGLNGKAKVYFQQAYRITPSTDSAQRLVILFLKDDQPEKALPYLQFLQQRNVSRSIYLSTISLIKEIIGYKNQLKGDASDIGLLNKIALSYYTMQNPGIALQYAQKATSLDKKNNETNELLAKIKSMPNQKLN